MRAKMDLTYIRKCMYNSRLSSSGFVYHEMAATQRYELVANGLIMLSGLMDCMDVMANRVPHITVCPCFLQSDGTSFAVRVAG